MQFDAGGYPLGQFVDTLVHGTADLHGVHTRGGCQGEADGGLPVVTHQVDGWIDVAPLDGGEILDADDVLTPHALRLLAERGAGHRQFLDFLG